MEFYNKERGEFLGRTAGSWARILIFYLIYYTFLAILMYFFVTTYQSSLPELGKAPKIRTRVDQPGSTVYPMAMIPEAIDNNNYLEFDTSLSNDNEGDEAAKKIWEKSDTKAYLDYFNTFKKGYEAKETDAEGNETGNMINRGVECINAKDAETKTCQMNDINLLTEENLLNNIKSKTPIVALALNKRIDWEPINYSRNFDNGEPFKKNNVYVKCHEVSVNGEAVDNSGFNFEFIGNQKSIGPEFYPYVGQDKRTDDKIDYNKPFILVKISSNNGWNTVDSNKDSKGRFYFSCYWDANNINKPVRPELWADNVEDKEWSMELKKMSLGVTDFSIKYVDASSNGKE